MKLVESQKLFINDLWVSISVLNDRRGLTGLLLKPHDQSSVFIIANRKKKIKQQQQHQEKRN